VRRAFDCLADPRVLDACSPAAADAFDPEAFIRANGTLYLLGSTGAQLSVAPLVSAIVEDLVERGRRIAAHSPGGRLDPPLLPTLPSLLADGGGVGIPTVAVFQSLAQARTRWGETARDAMWDAATIKILLGGLARARDLEEVSRLIGDYDEDVSTATRTVGATTRSVRTRKAPVLSAQALRGLGPGEAITIPRSAAPVCTRLGIGGVATKHRGTNRRVDRGPYMVVHGRPGSLRWRSHRHVPPERWPIAGADRCRSLATSALGWQARSWVGPQELSPQ
jgi:type IV secretion system protein VirD4